jgi:hypothetical protein
MSPALKWLVRLVLAAVFIVSTASLLIASGVEYEMCGWGEAS